MYCNKTLPTLLNATVCQDRHIEIATYSHARVCTFENLNTKEFVNYLDRKKYFMTIPKPKKYFF